MRKPIPKSVRKLVYEKYNGHCAYCGCEIPEKGFNVDHLYCLRRYEYTEEFTGINVHDISNLMPIKPENRKRYPANWKDIRKDILKRADNKCEFCGIENYAIRENGSKVVLTIAHLDHTPENCDYSNLRALCQKCHNRYDAKHRAETRRKAVE